MTRVSRSRMIKRRCVRSERRKRTAHGSFPFLPGSCSAWVPNLHSDTTRGMVMAVGILVTTFGGSSLLSSRHYGHCRLGGVQGRSPRPMPFCIDPSALLAHRSLCCVPTDWVLPAARHGNWLRSQHKLAWRGGWLGLRQRSLEAWTGLFGRKNCLVPWQPALVPANRVSPQCLRDCVKHRWRRISFSTSSEFLEDPLCARDKHVLVA